MTNREDTRQNFSSRQVLEALLIQHKIKKGIWQFGVEFGFGAGNIASDKEGRTLTPSAMIGVTGLSIVQVDDLKDNLCVDAAQLWKSLTPAIKRPSRKVEGSE